MSKSAYALMVIVGAFLFCLSAQSAPGEEGPKVLLIASEIEGYQNKIFYYLENIKKPGEPGGDPAFSDVGWFNLYPEGLEGQYFPILEGFDCVVTWSDYPFKEYPSNDEYYADDWGDLLKTYVDGGGVVVICAFCCTNDWALDGGIFGEGYAPLTNGGDWNLMLWDEFDLAAQLIPRDLLVDVDKLGCGWRDDCQLENWGDAIIYYQDGEYAFAVSEDKKVASINLYPGSAYTAEDPTAGNPYPFSCFFDWKDSKTCQHAQDEIDDFPEFLRNVILWLIEYEP